MPTGRSVLGAHAYRQLREEIVVGTIPPGAVLHEAQIAERLGVSRTPLREAIMRLSADRLVEIMPQHPARVTLIYRDESLDLIETWITLSLRAHDLAVRRINAAQLDELRELTHAALEGMRAKPPTHRGIIPRCMDELVVEASGSPSLQRLVERMRPPIHRIFALGFMREFTDAAAQVLTERLAAFEAGDADAAVAIVREAWQLFQLAVAAAPADIWIEHGDDRIGCPSPAL